MFFKYTKILKLNQKLNLKCSLDSVSVIGFLLTKKVIEFQNLNNDEVIRNLEVNHPQLFSYLFILSNFPQMSIVETIIVF